jgi:putative spermidine/putrescine transport system substrate-binding protein
MKRRLISVILTCFGLLFLVACSNSNDDTTSDTGKKELVVASWGGAGTEAQRVAWYEPFTEETGIKIKEVTPPSAAKLKAQVDSDNIEWDVVLLDSASISSLIKEGEYLEDLPYDKFEKELLEKLPEEAKRNDGIGAYYWAWALTYRTDAFDEVPQGWKDFWDVDKFPGPRTMPNEPTANLEFALMAMDVDPEDIYPIDEEKREVALDKISEIEPHVSKFWDAGAEGAQLLANNEAVMGNLFTAQAAAVIKYGAPVEIQWNGGMYAMDYWTVPKGQMSEEALKFIKFISQPERQAALAEEIPYGPVHEDAFDYIDKDIQKTLVTYPENIEKMTRFDTQDWWGSVFDEYFERWEQWKLE